MMLCKTNAAFAIFGLASTLTGAAPVGMQAKRQATTTSSSNSSFPTEVSPDGVNFRFPLSNSFPTPSSDQISDINRAAHGTFSNNTPPASISRDGITNLQFVAFNELFEVAFFTNLLKNVTQNVPGYEAPTGIDRQFLIDTLTNIQAQEQLHTLNANNGLRNVGRVSPIQPCEYRFPSTTLQEAILLAQTFTDVVLGTLQDVLAVYATAGDTGFVRGQASSLGQEGEQNGFFRFLQNKLPSAQPFLTTATRSLAFSALNQNFVVPGSCPNVNSGSGNSNGTGTGITNDTNTINLPIFPPLILESSAPVQPLNQQLSFSFQAQTTTPTDGLRFVLISGQNRPIVQTLQNVTVSSNDDGDGSGNSKVTFSADFAFQDRLLYGLSVGVVARGDETTLVNVGAVDRGTVYGPALIQVL